MKSKHDKGKLNGSCNREVCQKPGAVYFNHSTEKHYCRSCAEWLNSDPVNREWSLLHYGHNLCTLVEPAETK